MLKMRVLFRARLPTSIVVLRSNKTSHTLFKLDTRTYAYALTLFSGISATRHVMLVSGPLATSKLPSSSPFVRLSQWRSTSNVLGFNLCA